MSMRRISVLLVAVVMAMMLSMGPAFAHGNNDCDWWDGHRWHHECDDNNNGGGGANIPRIIVNATTSWI